MEWVEKMGWRRAGGLAKLVRVEMPCWGQELEVHAAAIVSSQPWLPAPWPQAYRGVEEARPCYHPGFSPTLNNSAQRHQKTLQQ